MRYLYVYIMFAADTRDMVTVCMLCFIIYLFIYDINKLFIFHIIKQQSLLYVLFQLHFHQLIKHHYSFRSPEIESVPYV